MPEEKQNNDELEYQEENIENNRVNFGHKIETLKNKLEQARKEKDEYLAGWQRAKADFINYKNDEKKRVEEFGAWSIKANALTFLPILDDLEKALSHLPKDLESNEWAKGILQIKNKFVNILKELGVQEIRAFGEKFNPEFHEAIGEEESDAEPGVITQEVERGYMLGKTVLRPARVKISKSRT